MSSPAFSSPLVAARSRDVTFRVDFPRPTRFAVLVDGVSGHGGAAMEIRLDGQVALQKDFPDRWPDGKEKMAALEWPRASPPCASPFMLHTTAGA